MFLFEGFDEKINWDYNILVKIPMAVFTFENMAVEDGSLDVKNLYKFYEGWNWQIDEIWPTELQKINHISKCPVKLLTCPLAQHLLELTPLTILQWMVIAGDETIWLKFASLDRLQARND